MFSLRVYDPGHHQKVNRRDCLHIYLSKGALFVTHSFLIMQKAHVNAFYSLVWLLLHTKQATISVLSCSVLVCSDQDGITVVGKAHMRSAPYSRSFFTVVPETVPMLIGLVTNGNYTTPLVMVVTVTAVINGLHYALSTALGHLRG